MQYGGMRHSREMGVAGVQALWRRLANARKTWASTHTPALRAVLALICAFFVPPNLTPMRTGGAPEVVRDGGGDCQRFALQRLRADLVGKLFGFVVVYKLAVGVGHGVHQKANGVAHWLALRIG